MTRDQIIRRAAVRLALANPHKGLPLPVRAKVEEQKLKAVLRGSKTARPTGLSVLKSAPRRAAASGRLPNGWIVSADGRTITDPRYAARSGMLQHRDAAMLEGIQYR